MPKLTRWFVRASLAYLAASLLLGLLLAAEPFLPVLSAVGSLRPVFFHLFMVGWLTQLIFGVMHWMFPRFSADLPRGSQSIMWFVFAALNVGLLLRTLAEPFAGQSLLWNRALAISASLQWAAALAFVVNTWPRVKER